MGIYGDLTLRDRLVRAGIGGFLGAVAGAFIASWPSARGGLFWHQDQPHPVLGLVIGALVGGIMAFRRTRIVS